ncbi:hypothetical protein OROHE_000450 [Orobanche hederae]
MWTGVPLQSWSEKFFEIACKQFGRMLEVAAVTKLKQRLDVAFIRVRTGLLSIDKILNCKIDGTLYKIRIEEIDDFKEDGSEEEEEEEIDSCYDSDGLIDPIKESSDDESVQAGWGTNAAFVTEEETTLAGAEAFPIDSRED